MENYEITPAPVTTADELFAKMDMILSATRQWTINDDDGLAAVLYRRLNELPTDIHSVAGVSEHWQAVQEKVAAINVAFQKKNYVNLQALNSLN